MTVTIDALYVKTFETNVQMLAQQQLAKLRGYVTEKNAKTSGHSFRTVGSLEMSDKTTGRTATPENDTPWANRIAVPTTSHIGDSVEPEDDAQTNLDPGSSIVRVFAAAANRKVDAKIIAAASGTALDEDGNNNALPNDSKLGGATQAFDYDLITQVAEKFMGWEIDPSTPKVAVVSPNCARKILNMTEATSSDYVSAKALSGNGFVSNWLGFDWVCSTQLVSPGANQRKCLFFTKDSMGLLVAKDIWTEIAKDPSKSFMWRYYAAMTMGAIRIQDKGTLEVTVLES